MAGFIFNGLGLPLGEKLVSTNDRLSNVSKMFRPFQSGGEHKQCASFCTTRLEVLVRHVCRIFRAKNRRSDPPVFNIE